MTEHHTEDCPAAGSPFGECRCANEKSTTLSQSILEDVLVSGQMTREECQEQFDKPLTAEDIKKAKEEITARRLKQFEALYGGSLSEPLFDLGESCSRGWVTYVAGDGKTPVLSIGPDGRIDLNPAVPQDEAVKTFMHVVQESMQQFGLLHDHKEEVSKLAMAAGEEAGRLHGQLQEERKAHNKTIARLQAADRRLAKAGQFASSVRYVLDGELTEAHARLGQLATAARRMQVARYKALVNTCMELMTELQSDPEQCHCEQLHVQLAGCGVAALGGTKDPAKRGDYGWSPTYQDVLELRRKYDKAVDALRRIRDCNTHSVVRKHAYDTLKEIGMLPPWLEDDKPELDVNDE